MQPITIAQSNQYAARPYLFKTTGISVFSLEEALYHFYYYWRSSLDDYISPEFTEWVGNELNMPLTASRINALTEINGFCARYTALLRLIPYFDDNLIKKLTYELEAWETVMESERYKLLADELNAKNEPDAALPLYLRALEYGDDAFILNNLAICLMKLSRADEAFERLAQALALAPSNTEILLNYTEAAIQSHSFNKAAALLSELRAKAEPALSARVDYLDGELNYETGDIKNAVLYYKKALDKTNDDFYRYKLSNCYIRLRMFDEAEDVLKPSSDSITGLKELTKAYIAMGHIPAAIKCLEKALLTDKNNCELWLGLAACHRLNYNHQKADEAADTALAISPGNELVLLEKAKIFKAKGSTKQYHETMRSCLDIMKQKYREKQL